VFAGFNEALSYFVGIENLQNAIASFLNGVFAHIGSTFWRGMTFMLLVHVYWFLGIHGSNMLETVAQNIFVPALKTNQELLSRGLAPTEIFTKTFFDAFVFMGGCGSVLCLLLAMFIVGRNKSHLGLAKMSLVPVLFNINELIIFGVPIVLNPIYLIPFICVPLLLTVISFFSCELVWSRTLQVWWNGPRLFC